mgnify:FL=1
MGNLALNISFLIHGFAAVAYGVLLGLIIQKNQYKNDTFWLFLAVLTSVVWALLHSASAVAGAYTTDPLFLFISFLLPVADWLRGILWIIFLFNHLRVIWDSQGNHDIGENVGKLIVVLAVIGFSIGLINISAYWGFVDYYVLGKLPLFNQLVVAFVILLLVENLYRNVASENRWGVRFFCLGLGSIYAFDFLLYGDSILYSLIDEQLYEARGAINIIVVPLLAVAILRGPKWSVGISLSRQAAFHTVSLVVGVAYLLVISVLGYYLQSFGEQWGKILQASFLFAGFLGFIIIVYSGKIRSNILVLINKYFFTYKFDYREEWLRFIQTMSATEDHYNLSERAIKSVANIMDCPGGALWFKDQPGRLSQVARWNFKHELDQDIDIKSDFIKYLTDNRWIVNLNDVENGKIPGSNCQIPNWLSSEPALWLVVPLIHHQEIIGFIVLYQPLAGKDLNWETIDILKTVSLQISSYLIEQESQKALAIASEFEAFNRKFAFVIHDIKNMASQLSLLHKNAEKHGDNPDFQNDMKLTIENTVEKMNDLLSRINIIREPSKSRKSTQVNIRNVLAESIKTFLAAGRNVTLADDDCEFIACSSIEDLETVFMHVIQNALDASDADQAVDITIKQDTEYVVVSVKDSGIGMDREFIRDELFRPFRSLKKDGYGIGAYESRQLIQSMGGRMEVKSKPNEGTIINIYLKKERED